MQAQGAMWLYDHTLEDWRYYLVTSLVDTLGRRKVYRLLLDAFERVSFPEEMTIEDVHLGSPNDDLFRRVSDLQEFLGHPYSEFHNCVLSRIDRDGVAHDIRLDGVIYRAVHEAPTAGQAARIDKQFAKRVKDLVKEPRKKRPAHA